jgi:AraC-like DNA-binding protein
LYFELRTYFDHVSFHIRIEAMFDATVDVHSAPKPILRCPTHAGPTERPAELHNTAFPGLPLDKVQFLNGTQIIGASTCGPVEVETNGASDQLLYVFALSGFVEHHNTKTHVSAVIPQGGAGVVVNDSTTLLRLGQSCRLLALQVPLSLLRSRFGLWSRKFCFQNPSFSTVADFRNNAVANLYHTLEFLLARRGEGETSLLDASYEQLLIAQLYATAPHDFYSGRAIVPPPSPRQLRSAEEFMRNNLYVSITIDDIASAAGCSTRSLQRIFRHFRNATPMQTLGHYRIAEANQLITSGKAKTITDVAANLRFSNPARFALMYRGAYGQKPSSILKTYHPPRELRTQAFTPGSDGNNIG